LQAKQTAHITLYHLKMVLNPKHVVAVTTEEEKDGCSLDGIIVKLFNVVAVSPSHNNNSWMKEIYISWT
jgi:hypothetical protein